MGSILHLLQDLVVQHLCQHRPCHTKHLRESHLHSILRWAWQHLWAHLALLCQVSNCRNSYKLVCQLPASFHLDRRWALVWCIQLSKEDQSRFTWCSRAFRGRLAPQLIHHLPCDSTMELCKAGFRRQAHLPDCHVQLTRLQANLASDTLADGIPDAIQEPLRKRQPHPERDVNHHQDVNLMKSAKRCFRAFRESFYFLHVAFRVGCKLHKARVRHRPTS
mmetsp:Transcript_19184/g.54175  ORF Transcript_19184/g.54175 Transcript_19184/m.54175 type:complete len:220 (-) Transcript_19184:1171-1830(-)